MSGRHVRTKPFILTSADSGSESSPVVYCGEPGAEVRLSGGLLLANPKPVTDDRIRSRLPSFVRDKVVAYDLAAAGVSDFGDYRWNYEHAIQERVARAYGQSEAVAGSFPPPANDTSAGRPDIYVDDRPMSLARGPERDDELLKIDGLLGPVTKISGGRLCTKEGCFTYAGDYPARWQGEADPYVSGTWSSDWMEQHHRIEMLDAPSRSIRVSKPYFDRGYVKGRLFFGFNMLCELDRPGEWMIDRPSRQLVICSPEGGMKRVEISMASRLVEMADVAHVVFRGITFEASRNSAISMTNCVSCKVEKAEIRNVGQYAVLIQDGSDCGVEDCDLHCLGGGGVFLVGGERKTLAPSRHYVTNSRIHDFGLWYRMYRPGVWMTGVGQRVAHNHIWNAPHSAILFFGNDLLIEYNEVDRVCRSANDCGIFYTGRKATMRGCVIRNNYLHHVLGFGGRHCRGIYLDDSCAGVTVDGNAFWKITWPVFIGGAAQNTISNNLFIDCPEAVFVDDRGCGWQKEHIDQRIAWYRKRGVLDGVSLTKPPYSTRYPELAEYVRGDWHMPFGNRVERNVFWKGDASFLRQVGGGKDPGDDWWLVRGLKKMPKEDFVVTNNLVNVDPKCIDFASGNLRLAEGSPAWKIGFKPIPFDEIGPRRDSHSEAHNAAPADELAREKAKDAVEVPLAPPEYRRPADWKPVLWPKSLCEIARDHSTETMARAARQMEKVDATNAAGKWKATGASIDRHGCPDWFVDAKLGIFVDWGPWSMASWCPYVKDRRLYPDWYEYRCRTDKTTIAYHEKNWGTDFKSDHFLDLFRGEKFNAPALISVFRKCGAKYVVPFLKHHSGFCLWDCSYTFRDTVDMGAHRDFAREMADACRAEGLKFGFYDSQAGEWEYPMLQEDGSVMVAVNRPGNLRPCTPDMEWKASGKVAVRDFVRDYIVPQATEFIDKYDPDIFWGDYDWMTFAETNGSYDIVAYMYNRAEGRKEVATNDRLGKALPEEIAGRFTKRPREWLRTVRGDFYTDEWGDTEECLDPEKWHPWESCSGISKAYGNHWMENADPGMVMSEREFVIHFSDIVARGGNLLLLVNLDPQGEIPAVQKKRLLQIGKWLDRWGEAIYATRILAPFSTKSVDYVQSKDGRCAYAIVKEPSAEIALSCDLPEGAKVTVVGSDAPLATRREGANAVVSIPDEFAASEMPFALKCQLRGKPF